MASSGRGCEDGAGRGEGVTALTVSRLDSRHAEGIGQGLGQGIELGGLDLGHGVEDDEEEALSVLSFFLSLNKLTKIRVTSILTTHHFPFPGVSDLYVAYIP